MVIFLGSRSLFAKKVSPKKKENWRTEDVNSMPNSATKCPAQNSCIQTQIELFLGQLEAPRRWHTENGTPKRENLNSICERKSLVAK